MNLGKKEFDKKLIFIKFMHKENIIVNKVLGIMKYTLTN